MMDSSPAIFQTLLVRPADFGILRTMTKTPKIGRPVTTGKSPAVLVAVPPALLKEIDRWAVANADSEFEPLSRPAAIRRLVARGLKAKG